MSRKNVIPSLDRPGNVFVLDVYKPQGRPPYAVATEGRIKASGNGYEAFETELFGEDRRHTIPLGGTNTAKRRANALVCLLGELEEKGWVEKGHTINHD